MNALPKTASEASGRERRGPDLYSDPSVKKFWDPRFGRTAVKVLPGGHYVTDDDSEMIVTVLGSCVAACIRDPLTGTGGMNHFMLPRGENDSWGGANNSMRFGNHAMEVLINRIMSRGCPRTRLEVKVFGAGNVIGDPSTRSGQTVGERNAEFVRNYLRNENLAVAAMDLGGDHGRRVCYFPDSGRVKRLLLRRDEDRKIYRQELALCEKHHRASPRETAGSVELFD